MVEIINLPTPICTPCFQKMGAVLHNRKLAADADKLLRKLGGYRIRNNRKKIQYLVGNLENYEYS